MAGVPSSAAFVVPALASLFAGALAAAFFGRRGSPAGRPRAFVRQRLARLPLPSISAGRLGGERRIAPWQTLQQMPPDTAERIPRTGIRAMIPGSRREWVGRQIRLYTKICVQKAPAQLKPHRGRARADRMGNPVRKTGAKRIKSPEMPSKCARPDQRRAKEGFPIPNGQQIGRKWAVKCRRAVDRRGMRPFCRRWRHSRDTAANNRRKRRQVLLGKPYGRRRKPRPAGTRPPKSSTPACTSSEWAQMRAACLRPFANPPATSSLTYQPIKRRRRFDARRVSDGRQGGHVRQRVPRRIFPRLPR